MQKTSAVENRLRLKIIDIAWRFVPKRWCWASMVLWASIYWKHYGWERKHKCGWCGACMTERELKEDVENFEKGLKT